MMTDTLLVFCVSCLAGLVYFLNRCKLQRDSLLSYPPGPAVTAMPTHDAWVQYRNWGRDYGQYSPSSKLRYVLTNISGELVYIQDRNILILNNSRIAIDLLEKRARIYSDRRVTPIMKLLVWTFQRLWIGGTLQADSERLCFSLQRCGAEFNITLTVCVFNLESVKQLLNLDWDWHHSHIPMTGAGKGSFSSKFSVKWRSIASIQISMTRFTSFCNTWLPHLGISCNIQWRMKLFKAET